jgi:hypothetical protein
LFQPYKSRFITSVFPKAEKEIFLRRVIASVLFILCGTAISIAQQAPQQSSQRQDKWEIFGGYTFERATGYPNASSEDFSAMNLEGGQASITYYPTRHLGVTGDFAALIDNSKFNDEVSYTMAIKTQDYLFGPTVRFGLKNAKYNG